jgi:hypothetical protein
MQQNLVLQKWTEKYEAALTERQTDTIRRFLYRQIIGSLVYISIWTRSDISYNNIHLIIEYTSKL